MIEITREPIDLQRALARVQSTAAGAVVLFLGTVREFTGGRQTAALEYEAYDAMAVAKMSELAATAANRWGVIAVSIVHRVGRLELGEVSVAVAVSSPHRREAFEAGQWLIDTLKETVPIWKRELWADGSEEWVKIETK